MAEQRILEMILLLCTSLPAIATIQFTQDVFLGSEESGVATACVELSSVSSDINPITNPIMVTVEPQAGGTAMLGQEHRGIRGRDEGKVGRE